MFNARAGGGGMVWPQCAAPARSSAALQAPFLACRYCEMNTCSIYNDCDVPQELTDQQIDQLQDQVGGAGGEAHFGAHPAAVAGGAWSAAGAS